MLYVIVCNQQLSYICLFIQYTHIKIRKIYISGQCITVLTYKIMFSTYLNNLKVYLQSFKKKKKNINIVSIENHIHLCA